MLRGARDTKSIPLVLRVNAGLVSIRSVLTWGFFNLALLGIGAAGLPLWAHHPLPRESLTIYVLICGQTLLASLLFPMLAETRWTLAINLSLLLPFDQLGGVLSNLDQVSIFRCASAVGIWITGLGAWRFLLKAEQTRMGVVAAAICFSAGGTVLDYLRWEAAFTNNQSESFRPLSLLPGVCDAVLHFNPIWWIQASLPMVLAIIWFAARWIRKNLLHFPPQRSLKAV